MTLEDFGKFLNRTFFLSLDRISGAGLVRIVYMLGLAVAALMGLSHAFATFRVSFGDGLWGLLEIAVFGLFGIALLRVVCEAFIVYFEANDAAVQTASHADAQTSLIDEVRDAIEQLGEDEKDEKALAELPSKKVATASAAPKVAKASAAAKPAAAAKTGVARRTPRTAKRTPRPKAGAGEG